MISCKRDVLERQSLSEVKIGRGSPICERLRKKRLWNNLKTMLLNVKLQRLCESHHVIKIFRETGEISVCKGQGRRPLLDACGLRALQSTLHHSSA